MKDEWEILESLPVIAHHDEGKWFYKEESEQWYVEKVTENPKGETVTQLFTVDENEEGEYIYVATFLDCYMRSLEDIKLISRLKLENRWLFDFAEQHAKEWFLHETLSNLNKSYSGLGVRYI